MASCQFKKCLTFAPLLVLLEGCGVAPVSLETAAAKAGFRVTQVSGPRFLHKVIERSAVSEHQIVFIEGDGTPWSPGGRRAAIDPTPNQPLAFRLMQKTPGQVIYITRPCYFGTLNDLCEPTMWTDSRYSEDVVQSMTNALLAVTNPRRPIVLLGYSGGGALAMLIAPRLANVVGVVTVAGLLDTDSWTEYHGYDRLSNSLNPIDVPVNSRCRYLHLIGLRDANISPAISEQAISTWPDATKWSFANYDHTCCWERDWGTLWPQISQHFGIDKIRGTRPMPFRP